MSVFVCTVAEVGVTLTAVSDDVNSRSSSSVLEGEKASGESALESESEENEENDEAEEAAEAQVSVR